MWPGVWAAVPRRTALPTTTRGDELGATAWGDADNVGFTKRGYGTLTLSGNNTFSGQLKVDNEGGTLRLTTAEPNAGQSMALPTVSIGNSLNAIPTVLKTLTANAIPSNSVISFGSGASGTLPTLQLYDNDPSSEPSFDQTIRGITGGNGKVDAGLGTITIDVPMGESYSYSGVIYASHVAGQGNGRIVKTGPGRQDFTQDNNGQHGEFVVDEGTVGIGDQGIFGHTGTDYFLTINGGTLMNLGGTLNPYVQNITIGGSFTYDMNGAGDTQFNGNAGLCITTLTTDNPTITVTGSTTNSLAFAGSIVDDAQRGFTKSGPGTLTLGSQGNSYRGETTILQGVLNVRYQSNTNNIGFARIGDGNGRVNLSGGTLSYNGSRIPAGPPVPW